MQKDFDKWNTEKKIVDAKIVNTELFFYAREIWWCSVGLNVGVEAVRKVGSISESDFKAVVLKLQKLLKIESPLAGAFSEAEATNI
jgi:hypothetical protein